MLRFLCLAFILACPAFAQPDTKPVAQRLATLNEGFWKDTQEPKPSVTSRGLFAYAFVLCEANQNLERLEYLFDVAAKMQDRTEGSKSFGNFKWSWSDAAIVDYNAVDFSMRGGALLWLKHRDTIPEPARAKLRELLDIAVEGCLRHKVSESYTNIALMNASDLILLGEALNKPNAADEGYKRLERELLYIHEFGIHEYVSPTYYGPDLDALVMIEAFGKRERGVLQARALLDYFWHDIALNWFAPAQRLSGAHSRSYDYLRGLGELDTELQLNGWVDGEPKGIDSIYGAQARWHPDTELKTLSSTFPRLVQQKWGADEAQWRQNYVQKDVALSVSGASYGGRMDFPLTVDFPGDRTSPRCYFTSDGRGDPYGKIKIAESAAHDKALHLNPFWAASQNKEDALGFVSYRDKDIPAETQTLQSHFVMPFDNDELWISNRKVVFTKGKAAEFEVAPDQAVILRKGSAALCVRVLWTHTTQGDDAPVNLVYDGNDFGAIRLTVTHYKGAAIGEVTQPNGPAAALFAVSVASNIGADWEATRQSLLQRFHSVEVEQANNLVSKVQAQLPNGALKIEVSPNFAAHSEPRIAPAVLSLNGEDIGGKILQAVEPLKSLQNNTTAPVIAIPTAGSVYFEAENAQILPVFEIGADAAASGGKFVWAPGEIGQGGGSGIGSVTWKLQNAQASAVYLWGRVQAPTPDDDSFFVSLTNAGHDILPATMWALGTQKQWNWVRLEPKLSLPTGETLLQLRVREDGAKIDRLFLTRDANEAPK